MRAPGDDDRFSAWLCACTAELAQITGGDLDRAVPTCPGWTLRQLATHLGPGHRWAAQIVATRATAPVPRSAGRRCCEAIPARRRCICRC